MADRDPTPSAAPLRVGYVMTHYPRLAQTFISGEIDAVEANGIEVLPFAMNRPSAGEFAAPGARDRARRTSYLKDGMAGAFGAALAFWVRHPLATMRIAAAAARSGGDSPRRIGKRLGHFLLAARLARSARAHGIRHLHAQFGLAPATIAWLASRLMSLDGGPVRFSFTIHGFHDFADPAETRLDLKAAAAAAVVCVSDFTRSQLSLLTPPALWGRYRVIRCGIELGDAPAAARGDGAPRILAVGRLSAEKGFFLLLDAMAELRDRGTAATLTLIGDGPERDAIAAAVGRLGIGDRVTLAGELPPAEVRAQLARSDIFCLPSFSEGLPVSIMEAMAAGVPVVATWIAGIPELAVDGVTALTVPPARADALTVALERLITDRGLRERLAAAARVKVSEHHDRARNGRAMAALLRELAA